MRQRGGIKLKPIFEIIVANDKPIVKLELRKPNIKGEVRPG